MSEMNRDITCVSNNEKLFKIAILGSRGIPARYGGFETFAERLSLYLASRGWEVSVYCQDGEAGEIFEENWNGVRLVHIPASHSGAIGTVFFDWKSAVHTSREKGLKLTLGYNTAIFCLLYRLKNLPNLINMDGIEWRRAKWFFLEKAWLYLNEWIGCRLGDHLIADNPEIKKHLIRRVSSEKVSVIPYGADLITAADASFLHSYGLRPKGYILIVARPEPENSIFEIVSAFSRKIRRLKLAVLGHYEPQKNLYHRKVMNSASDEVLFLGAVYAKPIVEALRFYAKLYCHGHTAGGTNPSLVEALGAGIPVLAHDNIFNRWVCGKDGHYFRNEVDCREKFDCLLADENELSRLKDSGLKRYHCEFTWGKVLRAYEALLMQWRQK